ncbi:MFS transporter [Pelagicoccus sp. SDUM812003]|uniref:MFS transporter n=1 Tax=Pelagicoccus sp. SDUM812003 TaxID=3041267 RepID=UPI00280D7249|nr:MFS transporter [Pelagicoccus sp. SDUM812003]MDQ8205290.1 MFS transporter [Pelagicoccus sp. SDUM812003]
MAASSTRRVYSWACFDFANSAFGTLVLTFIYNTYFMNGIAPSESEGTTLWGNTVAIASLVIALLSPALGAAADAFGWKKRFMWVTVTLACLATAGLYFPQAGDVWPALLLFGLALVATELSIVFNNAFLPEIAPREKHGKVSNQAFALGYFGGLICLFIAMAGFVNGEDNAAWFGLDKDVFQHVRATNVLVAIWFAVFSLPLLLWVKEVKPPQRSDGFLVVARKSFRRIAETFRHLREYRELFWMLVARMFYNDGLVAIFSFGGIYATVEFGFTFQDLMIFGIALNVCSGLGSLLFSFIEDRIGSRITIVISLLALVGATVAALFIESKNAFWGCAIVIGLFLGPNQSASRAYLSRLTPLEKSNEFFGFFAFSGKATAFLGPLLYGQMVGIFDSQRAGMVVIPVLMTVGMILFLWKTHPKPEKNTSTP